MQHHNSLLKLLFWSQNHQNTAISSGSTTSGGNSQRPSKRPSGDRRHALWRFSTNVPFPFGENTKQQQTFWPEFPCHVLLFRNSFGSVANGDAPYRVKFSRRRSGHAIQTTSCRVQVSGVLIGTEQTDPTIYERFHRFNSFASGIVGKAPCLSDETHMVCSRARNSFSS